MDCQLNQKQELQACMNNTPQNEASMIFRGQAGNGIVDIQKTSSVGLVDTYTIYYTDGNTETFTVTNGSDANVTSANITSALGYTPANPSDIGNGTITINQGGDLKGTFTTNQNGNTTIDLDAGGSGGGAVDSVNGQTGTVILTASDVGALPDSTVIPDAQIQSNWTQADNTKVDYIKNKPTIPDDSDLVHKTGTETISGTKTFTGNPEFKATAYNQCLTVNRDGTLGAFVAFKNSNGAIGAIGMHANQIPQCANYNNTDTRALVRAGYYTTSNPDAHVGDATTPVYIDANGVAQTCTMDLSNYADKALSNLTNGLSNTICTTTPTTTSTASASTPAVVVENYQAAVTGTRFVRVWSDGFCEQSGFTAGGASAFPVTLYKEYTDTNFVIFLQGVAASGYWGGVATAIPTSKSTFQINCQDSQRPFYWRTEGYIDLS